MAKRKTINKVDIMQPDELGALKQVVEEFKQRLGVIDNEISVLKDDRKELVAEFSEKLDMKTLTAAMKIVKIQQGVEHRDAFDCFLEVLDGRASDI